MKTKSLRWAASLWALFIGLVVLLASSACTKQEAPPKFRGASPQGPIVLQDKFYDIAVLKDAIWVVGYYGKIVYSKDGGKTWTVQQSGTKNSLLGVSFVNGKQGWAVGESGTIICTKDGGLTWKKQTSPATSERLLQVRFIDERRGMAIGTYGVILRTTDGGATWTRVPSFREDVTLNDLAFIDDHEGWIAGEFQTILHTTDGGATWTRQHGGKNGRLFGLAFRDSKHGVAVGTQGAVLVTADGGKTWKEGRTATADTLLKVRYFGPSSLMAVGLRGAVAASADDGKTWSFVNVFNHYTWLCALTFEGEKGFFVGNAGTIFTGTSNGGWTRLGMVSPGLGYGAPPKGIRHVFCFGNLPNTLQKSNGSRHSYYHALLSQPNLPD